MEPDAGEREAFEGGAAAALDRAAFAERWRREQAAYAAAVNAFVARGETEGWENAGEPPSTGMAVLAPRLLEILKAEGRLDRTEFPPCWEALLPLFEEQAVGMGPVAVLADGRMVVGAKGRVWTVTPDAGAAELPGVAAFGRDPTRTWLALLRADGVHVQRAPEGPAERVIPVPTSLRSLLGRDDVREWDGGGPNVDRLIPFPCGRRVLLVGESGVILAEEGGARLVHPDADSIDEDVARVRDEGEEDDLHAVSLSMAHADVSPDGRLIAVGDQCSGHAVLDAGTLKVVGGPRPASEYPHWAAFSADGRRVLFNSCHFYSGRSVVADAVGDGEGRVVEDGSRVYASAAVGNRIVVGNAYGYVKCLDLDAGELWQHFCGSTIDGVDLFPDGRTMAVTSYSGTLHLIDLDTETAAPLQIGTGTCRERWRLLFWADAPTAWPWR